MNSKHKHVIELTNKIFDSLQIGILQFDSKGKCVYANEFMYNLLGKDNNKNNINVCNLFREAIHVNDKQNELTLCENFLVNLQHSESTLRIYNNQIHGYKWYLINRIYLNRNENELNYMYTIQDIDEKKNLESQLENTALKQQELYKEKSSFLSNISHEIRTPINGIIGMLTLLEETDLSVSQQDYISMIKECSFNLMSIINDILDYSKLENKKITLDTKSLNLQECIDETNDIILSKIYEKGLEYNFKIDSNIPHNLLGDVNRLKQIILNLLTNSIKFTEQGKINLNIYSISNNTFKLLQNNYRITSNNEDLCYIRFDIIDTGCGISDKDKHKLFKSFSQIETNVLSKTYRGTGLGLAISKELIELMGGFIWLDKSSPSNGSTFSFVIPLRQCKQIKNEIADNGELLSENILQDAHILIVDDNLYNRMGLTGMVTKWGMKAFSFSNGEEALYYTNLYKFDMGLIDICMPKMDGLSFAIKLREQKNSINKNIPLVALSSLGDKVTNNINHFRTQLIKPIKENQLKKVCIDVLQHHHNNNNTDNSNSSLSTTCSSEEMADEYYQDQIKILIAEDSYINQKVLTSFLKRLGYLNCQTVENGQQCLDLAFRNDYDIIFMDIKMPVMDGDIAMQKLLEYHKQHSNKPKPFIIAVTAYSLKEDKDKYLQMGFDDYIPKPITIPELKRSLNTFLRKK